MFLWELLTSFYLFELRRNSGVFTGCDLAEACGMSRKRAPLGDTVSQFSLPDPKLHIMSKAQHDCFLKPFQSIL